MLTPIVKQILDKPSYLNALMLTPIVKQILDNITP